MEELFKEFEETPSCSSASLNSNLDFVVRAPRSYLRSKPSKKSLREQTEANNPYSANFNPSRKVFKVTRARKTLKKPQLKLMKPTRAIKPLMRMGKLNGKLFTRTMRVYTTWSLSSNS